jgi:CRP-like cAMP-binding protein
MLPFFTVDRRKSTRARKLAAYELGTAIYGQGGDGQAWRVKSGVVRLDNLAADGSPVFASLAIAGDIIGCETMLFGSYAFSACALTRCQLSPWPEGEPASSESLLESLARAQRRAADVVALRGGQAAERVLGLIRLLADRSGKVVLPTRQDIADITDLRLETISRIIKQFERDHVLAPLRMDGVHATRGYALHLA